MGFGKSHFWDSKLLEPGAYDNLRAVFKDNVRKAGFPPHSISVSFSVVSAGPGQNISVLYVRASRLEAIKSTLSHGRDSWVSAFETVRSRLISVTVETVWVSAFETVRSRGF